MSSTAEGTRPPVSESVERVLRMMFERLPVSTRTGVRDKRDLLRGFSQLKRNQGILAKRIAELEVALGRQAPTPQVDDDRFPPAVRSRVCTQAQFSEAWYGDWCLAMAEAPRLHRKLWEFAYISRVLAELDQLRPGRRGLGFGVGHEPLVALFAGRGCNVVATDLAPGAEEARVWANTNQHAESVEGLLRPALCDPEQFRKLVSWRPVDMRVVPADLIGFDFCWSACSLEHLGSLAAGTDFIKRSLATLSPGGVAVHTTEYNIWSDEDTVSSGHTVLYRKQDLKALIRELESAGHQVAALELDPGNGVLDQYIDLPPYVDDPHLRVWYGRFTTTSVALVIRAATTTS